MHRVWDYEYSKEVTLILIQYKSRLSLIVRVNVVLNRTVLVDSDWCSDDLCGSYLQSPLWRWLLHTSSTLNYPVTITISLVSAILSISLLNDAYVYIVFTFPLSLHIYIKYWERYLQRRIPYASRGSFNPYII